MKQVDILQIEDSWYDILSNNRYINYFESSNFKETMSILKEELANQPIITIGLSDKLGHLLEYKQHENKYLIYPDYKDIFNAYNFCSIENIKVVVISQDPYINGEAHGLAFSIKEGYSIAPSLRNIFQEIDSDLAKPIPENGDLTRWADQGILLLNSVLTVREKQSNSHKKIGWQTLTDLTIKLISDHKEGVVFLLWGKLAQEKEKLIDKKKHYVLKAAHPSPFSAYTGFFGCKHFSKTNQILEAQNKQIIDW